MLYTTISIIHVINLGRVQSATNNFAKCNYFGDALFGQKLMQKNFKGFDYDVYLPITNALPEHFSLRSLKRESANSVYAQAISMCNVGTSQKST